MDDPLEPETTVPDEPEVAKVVKIGELLEDALIKELEREGQANAAVLNVARLYCKQQGWVSAQLPNSRVPELEERVAAADGDVYKFPYPTRKA